MKIAAININNQTAFRSEEAHFSAYDDAISQARRDYIREHYDSWHLPYQSIYEKEGRLEEYDLNKLIGTLTGENKSPTLIKSTNDLDYELLDTMIVYNNAPITGTNSYRGSTLADDSENIKIAKKAGIKRVVDLEGYPNLAKECKEEGLEYFAFPIIDKFWLSHACKDKDFIVNRATHYWRDIQGKSDKIVQDNINNDVQLWENKKNNFIDNMITFINIMNKDNVYIGCMLGTTRTDCALMLNHFFNPKASITPDCITMINRCYLDKLETLYKNLTEVNKRELGWTKEFEAAFMPRLKKAINNSKYMYL